MLRTLGCLSVVPLLLLQNGCNMWGKAEINYRTIATDSRHDTERAKAEHAKALRILHRHFADKPADLAKAEQHLQRALVADVTYGPAHNTLGMLYYLQRKLYLAAWEYEYAAKLMPDRIEPTFNLGLVYECAENWDRAVCYFEDAFAKKPDNPEVVGALVRARLRGGASLDEMRPLLQQLLFLETRPDWVSWIKSQLVKQPMDASLEALELPGAMPEEIESSGRQFLPDDMWFSDGVTDDSEFEVLPFPTEVDALILEQPPAP